MSQAALHPEIAFIFDMDGVVLDSNPVHTLAWQQYLDGLGVTIEDLERRMLGRHNDDIVREFLGPDLEPDRVMGHGAAKEAVYRDLMGPQLERRLTPGLRDFLTRHDEVPTGLASNAEPANVRFVIDNTGLGPHFDVVLDGHQVSRPKPDPEIYLRTADCLGRPARDCIVFEDSLPGIAAARAAGARIVAIGFTSAPLPGVSLIVKDFFEPELERWLQRQVPLP